MAVKTGFVCRRMETNSMLATLQLWTTWDGCPSRESLTLTLLNCRIWWAHNNASKWQMGFISAFKLLILICTYILYHPTSYIPILRNIPLTPNTILFPLHVYHKFLTLYEVINWKCYNAVCQYHSRLSLNSRLPVCSYRNGTNGSLLSKPDARCAQ